MATSMVNGLLEHIHSAHGYLETHFGLDANTALDLVRDVLLELIQNGPEKLRRPRRYLFNACRIRALQILRSRRQRDNADAALEKRRNDTEKKDTVVLVALEDEDKPKFFGQATPKQQEVLDPLVEGKSMTEISAILDLPDSTVRMRIHLVCKRLGGAA
jgi:DNA-directed RNA polymerase specialized sigma24 family protein